MSPHVSLEIRALRLEPYGKLPTFTGKIFIELTHALLQTDRNAIFGNRIIVNKIDGMNSGI